MDATLCGYYSILETMDSGLDPYGFAESLLPFTNVLQLRQRTHSCDMKNLACKIAYLKVHNKFNFLINQDWKLAKSVGADGVHLRASSKIDHAKKYLGKTIVGISVHSVEEGIQCFHEGADYLMLGSIFFSSWKTPSHPVVGVEELQALVESVSIPVIGIGGVTPENLSLVKKTGAAGYSMISPLLSGDAREVLKTYQSIWRAS